MLLKFQQFQTWHTRGCYYRDEFPKNIRLSSRLFAGLGSQGILLKCTDSRHLLCESHTCCVTSSSSDWYYINISQPVTQQCCMKSLGMLLVIRYPEIPSVIVCFLYSSELVVGSIEQNIEDRKEKIKELAAESRKRRILSPEPIK